MFIIIHRASKIQRLHDTVRYIITTQEVKIKYTLGESINAKKD